MFVLVVALIIMTYSYCVVDVIVLLFAVELQLATVQSKHVTRANHPFVSDLLACSYQGFC